MKDLLVVKDISHCRHLRKELAKPETSKIQDFPTDVDLWVTYLGEPLTGRRVRNILISEELLDSIRNAETQSFKLLIS